MSLPMTPVPGSPRFLPYRLAAYFFAYYAITGAFVPFWPLYLQKRGLGADAIAACLSAAAFTRFTMPLAWGWLMDRSNRRMAWINGAMGVCAVVFAAMVWPRGSVLLLIVLHFAYAVFWNAIFPAFDVVALGHMTRHREARPRTRADYGRVRLWGSVGFIVAVLAGGAWYEGHSIASLPWVIVAGMGLVVGLGQLVPEVGDAPGQGENGLEKALATESAGFRDALRQPGLRALLFAGFMSQLSFAPYYGFFSIWLQAAGYPRGTIGALWALAVLAEVAVFTNVRWLMARFGARRLLAASLAVAGVRWVLIGVWPGAMAAMVLAQVLHLASFGFYHPASLALAGERFPGRLAGRGQALLMATTYGLGGFVGYLLTGPAWTTLGGRAVFLGAGAAALVGLWAFSRNWRSRAPVG